MKYFCSGHSRGVLARCDQFQCQTASLGNTFRTNQQVFDV